MKKDHDDQLLGELSRRNWIILACLVLISLLWRSLPVTLGLLSGGLVAIVGYYWRYSALQRLLGQSEPGAAKRFQFSYIVRLAALGAVLFLLIAKAKVDLIALTVGLSVVVVNILITTVKRSI